jgi:uncharacterized protein (TIGR03083 family)
VPSAGDQIKIWVLSRHPELTDLDPDLDLIETRLIDSLSFVEFVFHVEQVSGRPIDMDSVDIEDFRTLRRIEHRYLDAPAGERAGLSVAERLLQVEQEDLVPLLRSTPAADFDRPTVCTGWSVRDVVAHCGAALGGLAAGPEYKASHRQNQADVLARRGRPLERILDEFEHGLAAAAPVIAAAGGAKDLAAFGTWIHGGDVRDALGRPGAYAGKGTDEALAFLTGCDRIAQVPRLHVTLPDRELVLGSPVAGREPATLTTDAPTLFRLCTGRPADARRYRLRGVDPRELVSPEW